MRTSIKQMILGMQKLSHRRCLLLGYCLGSLLSALAFSMGFPRMPSAVMGGGVGTSKLKSELADKAAAVQRGLTESQSDQVSILTLVEQLERSNPTKSPTSSPLITARWRLIYTTSAGILGKTKPSPFRPIGPIYQFINLGEASARNEEFIRPVPFLPGIRNAINAKIIPESAQRVKVHFEQFEIGKIKFSFPNDNYLDTTYLDQDMRISRGGNGNVFVLLRDDPPPN